MQGNRSIQIFRSRFWPMIAIVLTVVDLAIGQTPRLIHPTTYIPNTPFPVVVEMGLNNFVSTVHNEVDSLHWQDNANADVIGLELKHGRTSALITNGFTGDLELEWIGEMATISAESGPVADHFGTIGNNETWQASSVHHITGDLTVAAGITLIIEPATWVIFDGLFNLTVDGILQINGTENNPVCLIGNGQATEWGGLVVNGILHTDHVFMIGGGADTSLAFGHSESQSVIKVENGDALLNRTYLLDNAGKGIGASGGSIQFTNGLIQRCDMGGEFHSAYADIRKSHILDTPNADANEVDDDNDGMYFNGVSPLVSGPSRVDSCVFHTGKDDGIDHNGAFLIVLGSIISDFDNEGIAASNANAISIYNTLVKHCEQGIEAGYGSPQVSVDHCVMYGNGIGLRFGDWYDWGCSGQINCTNSIMANNADNIHNFDVLANGPVANAIDVSYSLTNDADFDGETGCLTGAPLFSQSFHLESGSVGVGAADDSSNMGLVGQTITGIEEFDEAIDRMEILNGRFSIWTLTGRLVSPSATKIDLDGLENGMYFLRSVDDQKRSLKLVVAK